MKKTRSNRNISIQKTSKGYGNKRTADQKNDGKPGGNLSCRG
jgi:hypothetical protein